MKKKPPGRLTVQFQRKFELYPICSCLSLCVQARVFIGLHVLCDGNMQVETVAITRWYTSTIGGCAVVTTEWLLISSCRITIEKVLLAVTPDHHCDMFDDHRGRVIIVKNFSGVNSIQISALVRGKHLACFEVLPLKKEMRHAETVQEKEKKELSTVVSSQNRQIPAKMPTTARWSLAGGTSIKCKNENIAMLHFRLSGVQLCFDFANHQSFSCNLKDSQFRFVKKQNNNNNKT